MLKPPQDSLRHDDGWKEGKWARIEWWDDDSPPMMRFVGAWSAPKLEDPIGYSIAHGVYYYEDVNGLIRRVHWYNKKSGFEWLLAPCRAQPDTVLRHSLSWEDWRSLRGMHWKTTRDPLLIIYHRAVR